jgi:hypothetical protein
MDRTIYGWNYGYSPLDSQCSSYPRRGVALCTKSPWAHRPQKETDKGVIVGISNWFFLDNPRPREGEGNSKAVTKLE